ncbi:coenzyme Q-binding protein COQ10 homolog A, mitochondrial [Galendromus occidentalis]|uniref:Coenzyme Q-binding protein COQ10 homolog A, mitochondrial n=1 Tax=Galendromus occidentalis TaxID=34638 RepID=A0AAJ6VYI0_9ACAR|nr:coenzyme Q-binding protein COQ10 homolog A, mitochondrial [Galendromus occidentalis]
MATSVMSFRTSRILTKILIRDVQGCPSRRTLFGNILGAPDDTFSHRDRRLIGYSQEQMYAVISETKNYPEFLPWCTKLKRFDERDDSEKVLMTVGFPPFEETYVSRVIFEEPSKVRSFSAEGTFFKDLDALWTIEDCGKDSCILSFRINFKLKSRLHAPLAKVFFKSTALTMSRAFIGRAGDLYGEPSCREKRLKL